MNRKERQEAKAGRFLMPETARAVALNSLVGMVFDNGS